MLIIFIKTPPVKSVLVTFGGQIAVEAIATTEENLMALNPGDLYFENMFNDSTRILEGGLWHNNVPVGNQGNGTDGRYVADLQLVQTGADRRPCSQ